MLNISKLANNKESRKIFLKIRIFLNISITFLKNVFEKLI